MKPIARLRTTAADRTDRVRAQVRGPATVRRFKGYRFGRLIVTTCCQPTGAPLVDDGYTIDADDRTYRSYSLLLAPWRKNTHGEHARQRALTIGWRA